ncbi:MAG: hypothetical protein JNL47_08490 [Bacteroidia bacterium]|nr:hypothetical protein [Bacteroidia bacterium]
MPARTVVHMDLDCFFVSVSRLLHPELNNKPVMAGGGGIPLRNDTPSFPHPFPEKNLL